MKLSEIGELVLIIIVATVILGYLLSWVHPWFKRYFGLDSD